MALPNLKQALKGAVMGAAAAGMTLAPSVSFPAAANAQSASAQRITYRASDAARMATEYSERNNGVGIVIFYGKNNPLSAEQIGNKFVQGFQKRGANAQYFIAPMSHEGASMAFHVGPVTRGPMNVNTAVANIDEIVRLKNTRQRLLAHNSL